MSAQVVLEGPGDTLDSADIVAANAGRFTPDGGKDPRDAFTAAGFTVGSLVGTSFSIEGPAELFDRWFSREAATAMDGSDLPLDRLTHPMRRGVSTVVRPEPPEYMP